MNLVINAHKVMAAHIKSMLASETAEELAKKHTKLELAQLVIAARAKHQIGVEELAKPIMEDTACAWLTWSEIALAIATALGSETTNKSIASYASKNPEKKGWVIPPRKSQGEVNRELMKLAV